MRIASLFIVIALTLSWLPQAQARELVKPPYVRHWTCLADDNAFVVAVKNGVVYYLGDNGVGAVTLATGQTRWTALAGQKYLYAQLAGNTLFVLVPEAKAVYAIAADTGKVRVLAHLSHPAEKLEADASNVYVLDGSTQLTALAQATGKVVWSRKLAGNPRRAMTQFVLTDTIIYVGIDDFGELGVDPKTGKTLWNRRCDYASLYLPHVVGDDVITYFTDLRRTNVRTGKVLWKTTNREDVEGVFGKVVVTSYEKTLKGYSIEDGHALWKLKTDFEGSRYLGLREPDSVTNSNEILLSGDITTLSINQDGKLLWKSKKALTGTPVYADQNYIITMDVLRLLCYKRGTLPPLPQTANARKALAEKLAGHLELIDNAERDQLNKLKPYAFAPFLKKYMEWAQKEDALSGTGKDGDLPGFKYYCMLTGVDPLLVSLCEKADTPLVMDAWRRLGSKSGWRAYLEYALQKKGDPAGYVPILVENLRKTPSEKRTSSMALSAVALSSQPEAVALMLEALNNPKAASAWRTEAFQHLAKTGGEAGVAAVRAAQATRKERKPWFDWIDPTKLRKQAIKAVKQEETGRTWMLFQSEALGNEGDLFIVEKKGDAWGRPIFTGAWTGRTFRNESPKTFRGIPLGKLIESEWIRIFPEDASLRKDTDGDGLTDLVEERLGLDPSQADTDKDGLSDAVDPCPNVAPRALGDTEKIVAACIEAHFFEADWYTPAIVIVEGLTPFELYGYPGVVLWGSQPELLRLYGGGVNQINFMSPDERGNQKKPFITYSADHKSARTIISRYSGGLNGEGMEVFLQKIGDDWFVVDIQGRWVS
ncbi:MAG: PQQ-binding-like beta-propeller repeat protein [Armatimonas sp.]